MGMAATHQNYPRLSRWKGSVPIAAVAVALAVAAGGMIAFSGTAGEPIRFTRPKPQEKAPLRFNYSSEPAQAKEKASIRLPQSSTGPQLPSTLSVNRKSREASRGRWETTGTESADDTAARARMELQRWRMSAAEDERSSGKREGVFGENGAQNNRPPVDNAGPSRPPPRPDPARTRPIGDSGTGSLRPRQSRSPLRSRSGSWRRRGPRRYPRQHGSAGPGGARPRWCVRAPCSGAAVRRPRGSSPAPTSPRWRDRSANRPFYPRDRRSGSVELD